MGINSPSSRNFIRLENILIIGNGGRENSLAWAIQKNELVKKVYLIPGNAGSERINKCERIKIDINNKNELVEKLNFFKIDFGIGTTAELKNNIFTGHFLGEPTFSKGKVKAVEKWCLDNGLKVNQSIFYSDSINDLPMFEVCGVPIAVNPDDKLRKIAEERSFRVINR